MTTTQERLQQAYGTYKAKGHTIAECLDVVESIAGTRALSKVPDSKVAELCAAFLASGNGTSTTFMGSRPRAGATLDAAAIMNRWNNPPKKTAT